MRGLVAATILASVPLACERVDVLVPPADGIRLRDATEEVGLADVQATFGVDPSTQIPEVKGGGLALIDLEGDGDLDIVLPNGATLESPRDGPGAIVLRNRLAEDGVLRFEDVSADTGLTSHRDWSFGVAVGDVDGDRRDDLVVCTLGRDRLWLNRPEGFIDATEAWGMDHEAGWSSAAGLGDLDGDGDLDLVVLGYLDFDPSDPPPASSFRGIEVLAGPRGLAARRDVWYENVGDRFVRREVDGAARYGLNLVVADLDRDGRQDVLVGNDSEPNQWYRNEGGWRFVESALPSGLATNREGDAQATMGMALADVDGDGTPDVFSTNFASDTNTLHANLDGWFDDRTRRYGLAEGSRPMLGWATEFVDLDHDGDEDLLAFNGHVYPQATRETMDATYAQSPGLWRRDAGRFHWIDPDDPKWSAVADANPWLSEPRRDRSAVFADLDHDGDVDVVVASQDGTVRCLLNRRDRTDDWIQVLPVPATGAEVEVRSAIGVQRRWLRGGGPFLSNASPVAHVGLPAGAGDSVEITVRWPDGSVRRVDSEPGRRVLLHRADGENEDDSEKR